MPDLMTALRNADQAGDLEAATRISEMIKNQNQTQAIDPNLMQLQDLLGRQAKGEQGLGESISQLRQQTGELDSGKTFGSGGIIPKLEVGASMVSGIIAQPIAGIAGTLAAASPFSQEGAGGETVRKVQEALTFQPRTVKGKELQSAGGEALKFIAEPIKNFEESIGGGTLEITGSPALAAAVKTIPAATLELLTFKLGKVLRKTKVKTPSKKQISRAIVESAPELDQIKSAASKIYKEIDESGVLVKDTAFNSLVGKIKKATEKSGLDKGVTPVANAAVKRLIEETGQAKALTKIDTLRKVAQKVASNIDKTENSLGNIMLSQIDDFLSNLSPNQLIKGTEKSSLVGKKFKVASELWGRVRRSEAITEAITKGSRRAAGAEAGIRNELNSILNSRKTSKFFPKSELKIMREVVKGNFSQNFSRMLGKMGLSIDRSPNVFGSLVGGGAGSFVGGTAGAVLVPLVGTVSKQIAKNLTTKKANFVDSMIRAGKDSRKIAEIYLKAVPKNKRSVKELSDLLSDPKVDLSSLEFIAKSLPILERALDTAKGRRAINLARTGLISSTTQELKKGASNE